MRLAAGGREWAEILRHAGIWASEIGTDLLPMLAAISGLEQNVRAQVKRVRIDGREQQRRGAVRAILAGAQRRGRNILILPGGLIEAIGSERTAAINNVGIERVGRDVSIFLYAHRMPIA